MPLKLIEPNPARRTPNYCIRGTYQGVSVNRSTGTPDKAVSRRALEKIKHDIERGRFAKSGGLTFAAAASSYLDAGGEGRFILKLNEHLGDKLVADIDQAVIDKAAAAIYPHGTPATRNRQVYSPMLAILHHAGIATRFRRPKGSKGDARTIFLEPAEAWRLLDAAEAIDRELGAMLTLCLYTGLRLSEALGLQCQDVALAECRASVGKTKNGDPRTIYFPAPVVAVMANHPKGLNRVGRVFKFRKCGAFYDLLDRAYKTAGVDPRGAPAHILRHTYGTWMRRYAGADTRDLLDTGAWRDASSANRYTHTDVSHASRLADKMPVRNPVVDGGLSVDKSTSGSNR